MNANFLIVLRLRYYNLRCQHESLVVFSNTGMTGTTVNLSNPGGDKCPVCIVTWYNLFLSLLKLGVVKFLQREECLQGNATVDRLITLVWQNNDWKLILFGIAPKPVNQFQVKAMYLQLITVGFLESRFVSGILRWCVCRNTSLHAHLPYRY